MELCTKAGVRPSLEKTETGGPNPKTRPHAIPDFLRRGDGDGRRQVNPRDPRQSVPYDIRLQSELVGILDVPIDLAATRRVIVDRPPSRVWLDDFLGRREHDIPALAFDPRSDTLAGNRSGNEHHAALVAGQHRAPRDRPLNREVEPRRVPPVNHHQSKAIRGSLQWSDRRRSVPETRACS